MKHIAILLLFVCISLPLHLSGQCKNLTLNPITGQLDCQGNSGGGGQYSTASTGYTIGTYYFPPGGGLAANATESSVQGGVGVAGSITNFTAVLSAAPGVGNTITFTWRKATPPGSAGDQVVTCAISGGTATSCSDTTHTFNTSAGDLLDIKAVVTGGTVTAALVMTWGLPGIPGIPGANGSAASTTSTFSGRPAGSAGEFWTVTDCVDYSCSAGSGLLTVMQWSDGANWHSFMSVNSCPGCAGSFTLGAGTGVGGFGQAAIQNCASTGTTLNKMAKVTGGCAVIATTGDTAIPLYCVAAGAGTSGYPTLVLAGQGSCTVEAAGGVTADHFLVASSTTAGTLHDAGATAPTSGWVIGQALANASANAAATYTIPAGYNATSSGSGGNMVFTSFTNASSGNQVAGSTTDYLPLGGTLVVQSSNTIWSFAVHRSGTFKNMCFTTSSSQPAGGNLVMTLEKNGSDTALVATATASAGAGEFCDTTHTVSVVSGDTVMYKIANGSGSGSAFLNVTYAELQ